MSCALGWLDEVLFGWSEQSKRPFSSEQDSSEDLGNGHESGYTSDEPDYDEVRTFLRAGIIAPDKDAQKVIQVMDRFGRSPTTPSSDVAPRARVRSRSRSRSRSKSALDLTSINQSKDSSFQS